MNVKTLLIEFTLFLMSCVEAICVCEAPASQINIYWPDTQPDLQSVPSADIQGGSTPMINAIVGMVVSNSSGLQKIQRVVDNQTLISQLTSANGSLIGYNYSLPGVLSSGVWFQALYQAMQAYTTTWPGDFASNQGDQRYLSALNGKTGYMNWTGCEPHLNSTNFYRLALESPVLALWGNEMVVIDGSIATDLNFTNISVLQTANTSWWNTSSALEADLTHFYVRYREEWNGVVDDLWMNWTTWSSGCRGVLTMPEFE